MSLSLLVAGFFSGEHNSWWLQFVFVNIKNWGKKHKTRLRLPPGGEIFNDPSFLQQWRQQTDRSVLNTKYKLDQVKDLPPTNPSVFLSASINCNWYFNQTHAQSSPNTYLVMGRNWLGQFFKPSTKSRTAVVSYQSILRTRQCLSISIHVCCIRIIDQSDSTRTE